MFSPRNSLTRSGPIKRNTRRARPAEGPMTPDEWCREAYRRSRSREELRGERLEMPGIESEVHHVLPKRWLRREGLFGSVWDPRNAMVLRTADHQGHESAMRRIPRSRIRPDTWEFIRELGDAAVAEIERTYPEE